jgi:hypothetical protein
VSKEQLEASLKTFEWLVQVSTVILAIGTVGAAGFGVRTWLLSNRIKKLQHVEDLRTQTEIARLNKETADAKERTAKTELEIEKEKAARIQLQTAIAPHRLSTEEQEELTEACRPFAKPDIHIVVKGTLGNEISLGVQIAEALRKAGFTAEWEPYRGVWYELSVSGPKEHLDVAAEISGLVAKKAKMAIMGVLQVLPSGSPITIVVGERHMGELPKITRSPSP